MWIYRPHMLARLFLPNLGTAQQRVQQEQDENDVGELTIQPFKCRLVANNHNEADECEITCTYDDAGIDPRFERNAELYLYLGNADDYGNFTPSVENLRFVGIAHRVTRHLPSDGKFVTIGAHDYTSLFLSHKNGFPPEGLPRFTDTIRQAWERVCDHTGYYDVPTRSVVSSVQRLKNRLQFVGVDESLTLGKAVSPRVAKLGYLEPPRGADAWAVWQTAVGSLGLISFIRGDRCIVTTATDYYTADDPPRLIYGENIEEIEETRDQGALSAKNVGLLSFDALTGKTLEAYYPPLSDVTPKSKGGGKRKRVVASALGPGVAVRAQDYEVFQYPYPVTDQATLDFCAQRVWEERSRQELKGTMKTKEIFVDTLKGQSFDLIGLQAGDRIRVEIDQAVLTEVQAIPTLLGRELRLQEYGYSAQLAAYIAKNLSAIGSVSPEFQVHQVVTELDTSGDDGTFEIAIEYLNRIDPSGSADPGSGEGTTAITGQS